MSEEIKKKKIFDFSLLRRVFQYAAPYKSRIYLSVALSILLAVLSPLRPFLIQVTINDYIRRGAAPGLSLKEKMESLVIWVTILQIVLLLIETVSRFYFSFITAWLGQTVVKDLRVDVYKKVLGLNLSQFDKTPIGTLTTRTINDIEAINDIFGWSDTHHRRSSVDRFHIIVHVLRGLAADPGLSCALSLPHPGDLVVQGVCE